MMDIVIINDDENYEAEMENSELASLAFLIAQRMHLATPGSIIISIITDMSSYKDSQKRDMMKRVIPGLGVNVSVEKIDDLYQTLKDLRKKKGKSMLEIKLLRKSEEFFLFMEKIVKDYYTHYLRAHGIANLLPYTCYDESNIITIWTIGSYNANSRRPDLYLHCVASNMYHLSELPFFAERFESVARRIILPQIETSSVHELTQPVFLSEPMFILPVPRKLESNQLLLLRNELQPVLQPWHEVAQVIASEFVYAQFVEENYPVVQQVLSELKKLSHPVQSCIDNHPFVELLRSNDENFQFKQVHVGITSMENIISIYKALKIITPEEALYVLDEVSQHVNLQSCGMFLYLQPYNE